MKPGPQSATFRAGRYAMPRRPEPVGGWLIGLGIVLMLVAGLGAAVACALSAMQPK